MATPAGVLLDSDREPIRLPGSPFWNVFRSFGRDEMIALGLSLIGTLILSHFTHNLLLLALVGPVVEKIGFYPWHLYEAWALYRATRPKERLPLRHYVRKALGGGTENLMFDLLAHDPCYVVLMVVALLVYPTAPAWLMSVVCFLAAAIAASWLKVLWTEGRYKLLKRRLIAAGFDIDTYLEARFYIRWNYSAKRALEELTTGLGLHRVEHLRYHDTYFLSALPRFSGRSPVVRLRRRTFGKSSARWRHKEKMVAIGYAQTLQVVYTRPQEEEKGRLDQFRFFSVEKDKFFYPIDQEHMPAHPSELTNARIGALLRAGRPWKEVQFERTILLDESDALYVAVDALPGGDGCVIELKVRKERILFLAAMRHVMMHLPVTHTTLSKTELELN
jgi:hypothetical protein